MVKPSDPRPAYQKIAADLRAQIMDGRISGRLPSIEALKAKNDGAANATIQNAIKVLRDEGLIASRQGQSVFVRQRAPLPIHAKAYIPKDEHTSYKVISVGDAAPPPDVAEALGYRIPDRLPVLRKRLMLVDDEPIELSYSYHPAEIADAARLRTLKGLIGGAAAKLAAVDLPQRTMTDLITCRPPTTEELEALDLPPGVSVLRTFRVIRTDGDRVVEVCVMYKGVHVAELKYELPVD